MASKLRLGFLCCMLAVLAGCAAASPVEPPPPVTEEADPAVLAAGDIGECQGEGPFLTANLLDHYSGTILAVGDLVYPSGTAAEFSGCYASTWGRYRERTHPVPGNHEYITEKGRPYFTYWGERAGSSGEGYYSFDLGAWHIVALNSNIDTSPGSAQVRWLREDLARSPARCKLAFFHHTVFTSGYHGRTTRLDSLVKALYEGGISLVVTGHDHHYERFAPMSLDGHVDPEHGIRFFVVGTGGATRHTPLFGTNGSETASSGAWGVLRLMLHEDGYDWRFLPVDGEALRDAGRGTCVPTAAQR
jgi:hypothetical protein